MGFICVYLRSSAVNFCRNLPLFIHSLSRLPTFPLACAALPALTLPPLPLDLTASAWVVVGAAGGGHGCENIIFMKYFTAE